MMGLYQSVRVHELKRRGGPIIVSAVKGYARGLETRQLLESVEADGGASRSAAALGPRSRRLVMIQ